MINRLFFLIALVSLIVNGCQTKVDMRAGEDAIMKTDSAWGAAATQGKDIDKIVSYWTDDAVVLPPGQPAVEGKEALRQFVKESVNIPGFNITWKSSKVHLSPDGKMAYMYSENLMTMNDSTGKKISMPGRGYTVWRKESDGNWKCVVDIWNNPPAAK
ncbi:MAG: YybH family protein [Chitinophagales bacterium]